MARSGAGTRSGGNDAGQRGTRNAERGTRNLETPGRAVPPSMSLAPIFPRSAFRVPRSSVLAEALGPREVPVGRRAEVRAAGEGLPAHRAARPAGGDDPGDLLAELAELALP